MEKHGSVLICNGEIYNYKTLAQTLIHEDYTEKSDCEIILDLYKLYRDNKTVLCNLLDGDFAFVLKDQSNVFAARDPIGVRPLFYGRHKGCICFASEAKALISLCTNIYEFPPGHYYDNSEFIRYEPLKIPHHNAIQQCSHETLKHILTAAVEKRLDSERPVGFFLSGGLDSSLVCAISSRLLNTRINTFSVGINDTSPDILNARKVATHIQSNHTEILFSTDDALNVLEEVIYQLESYDCTTIRASVPMYIMSKYVAKNTDFRVILSGEGADELFGGYLYFHNAPNEEEFHNETQRLLSHVHDFDVLRADRCTAGNGLELRVPFFDKALRHYVSTMHPTFKRIQGHVEKKVLRDAFSHDNMLPRDVLYRQKNGMSDAVGYSWVDFIKNYANTNIGDDEFATESLLYPHNCPVSKEELYYRRIYNKHFGDTDFLPHIWRPKYTDILDPSATLLKQFKQQDEQEEP